eukprot:SAG31_NODE_1318_length_8823_cov_3.108780_2_plen_221_part_00
MPPPPPRRPPPLASRPGPFPPLTAVRGCCRARPSRARAPMGKGAGPPSTVSSAGAQMNGKPGSLSQVRCAAPHCCTLGRRRTYNFQYLCCPCDQLGAMQVRAVTFSFLCPLLEKYGTFIARCNALIEKVSSFIYRPTVQPPSRSLSSTSSGCCARSSGGRRCGSWGRWPRWRWPRRPLSTCRHGRRCACPLGTQHRDARSIENYRGVRCPGIKFGAPNSL